MSRTKRTWRRRIGQVTVYQRGNRYWIYYRQGKQVRRPVGTIKEEALALAYACRSVACRAHSVLWLVRRCFAR